MDLENMVFAGELEIAIFVVNRKHHFVFDDKENYIIDIETIYKRYLENGIISPEQYEKSLHFYRGGASVLNKNNIFNYFSSLEIQPKDETFMREYFSRGYNLDTLQEIYRYTETQLAYSNKPISLTDWFKLKARLPRFYINLDRNIFMHTNWDRDFENNLPTGWIGQASYQFGLLVPDHESYWNIEGMNFWKLYSE